MYPDLSAFGRADFPVSIGAFRGPVPLGETGGGEVGSEMLPGQKPGSVSKSAAASYPMLEEQYQHQAPDPVSVPDPIMMADQAQKEKMSNLLKYGIIGLLGTLSGLLVAQQMGKSKAAGAGIGGLGSIGILLIADFIKFSQGISKEISPLFVPDDV